MPGLLLSSPIATARGILNDPDAVRYSAADLLQYANDAIDQLVTLVPMLFYTHVDLACVAGATLQSVPASEAKALININRIKNGNAVTRIDKDALEAYNPGWHLATAAAAKHWMPVDDDPLRFYIYPPAPASQTLDVTYVKIPAEFAVGADTGLPTSLSDAIADYVVGRADSRDSTHVMSGRAAQFMSSFIAKVKGV